MYHKEEKEEMTSHHHFLSFMEKDSWVIKIERIEKLFDQILQCRGTRRAGKIVELKTLLHTLIPDMDVWYAERANVTIDFRTKVADLRIENEILKANLKDTLCGYKTLQTLIRKELPNMTSELSDLRSMEEPDPRFLDSLSSRQEEETTGTKQ